MPDMLSMDPNLVGSSGIDQGVNQGGTGKTLRRAKDAARMTPGVSNPHDSLPTLQMKTMQWGLDRYRPAGQAPCEQGNIMLLHDIIAKKLMQLTQAAAPFGNHQQAAGFTIKPMHQFQKRRLRSQRSQALDDAMPHPAAAVHSKTGRLVYCQQALV